MELPLNSTTVKVAKVNCVSLALERKEESSQRNITAGNVEWRCEREQNQIDFASSADIPWTRCLPSALVARALS